MSNLESLRAILSNPPGQPLPGIDSEMLDGMQVLRQLEKGELFLLSRKRIESIIDDLNQLERRPNS